MLNSLIILDGFGIAEASVGNAIRAAKTPFINSLLSKYPNTLLGASGLDVGLPEGQMGNSEVGHINMGAGRVVYQELTRISKEIKDGDFYHNPQLLAAMEYAKKNNKALHTFGLLSDGGVHSHIEHLFALIKMSKEYGVKNIFVHCFMDGRDVSPTSGANFLRALQNYMDTISFGSIATVVGRYYAMDRDNRWDRVEIGYDAMTKGTGTLTSDIIGTVEESYTNGVTDEFLAPIIAKDKIGMVSRINEGDAIIFFNFRPDRAREITRALINKEFVSFERKTGFLAPYYVGFTCYDVTFTNFNVAFEAQSLQNNLGQVLAANNKKQLRIAETEKYAHVTFFFNSGVEAANPGEDRVLISSPKVATYDLQPEMSAPEVADKAVELIRSNKYDVMILNFANCDMVGHTGVFQAAVEAVASVDSALEKVVNAILEVGGQALITADHGNADKMYDTDGSPFTPHTTNPVPLIVIKEGDFALASGGALKDIAPTLLEMMNIAKPLEMTGSSLIR